ncbi:MAG TPA: hypothetical protein VK558_05625 [Patescibacteria group bacterium]|nr:hypothetical protein [Patescibacteria group bacterium]
MTIAQKQARRTTAIEDKVVGAALSKLTALGIDKSSSAESLRQLVAGVAWAAGAWLVVVGDTEPVVITSRAMVIDALARAKASPVVVLDLAHVHAEIAK